MRAEEGASRSSGDVLERALGRLLGLALHEERVVRFLGDVLQRRLVDRGGVLRRHDLVAAHVLEQRQRVDHARVALRLRDERVEQRARARDEIGVVGGEARERAVEPRLCRHVFAFSSMLSKILQTAGRGC